VFKSPEPRQINNDFDSDLPINKSFDHTGDSGQQA